MTDDLGLEWFSFEGSVYEWRGPAPFYFVSVPEEVSAELKELAPEITYGWGVLPVCARIGDTEWTTSLIPREGLYALPLKIAVRRAAGVAEDDVVAVSLTVGSADPVRGAGPR